jgi:hypothetical protein
MSDKVVDWMLHNIAAYFFEGSHNILGEINVFKHSLKFVSKTRTTL